MIVWLYPTLLAVFFAGIAADTPLDLGDASSFAILAGSAITTSKAVPITTSPLSTINGDIGNFPGTAITGFPPQATPAATFGICYGDIYAGAGSKAETGQSGLDLAYATARTKPADFILGSEMNGMVLTPGVYSFPVTADMSANGVITLDAQGDPNAVWTLQVGTAMTFWADSKVVFKNGIGNPEYVYWVVGSSATLWYRTQFIGTILARVSITAWDYTTISGRLLCKTAVTMTSLTMYVPSGGPLSSVPTAATTRVPTASGTSAPMAIATKVPTIAATSFPTAVPRTSAPSLKKKKDCKSKAPTAVTNNYLDLGDAALFAILAGTQVNTDGSCVITGDIGVFPGSTVTGIPSSILHGVIHAGVALADSAQLALSAAYYVAASKNADFDLSGADMAGMTLLPGVYMFTDAGALNGLLTLDAQGDADAAWIIQVGSSLVFGVDSTVRFKFGVGNPEYVYWQVGTSATISKGATVIGNILAYSTITTDVGAAVNKGRLLAKQGLVSCVSTGINSPAVTSAPSAAPTAAVVVATASPTAAQKPAVNLRSAGVYAILAASAITATGPNCKVVGNIGTSPAGGITGFDVDSNLFGVQDLNNAASLAAKADVLTAYFEAKAKVPTQPALTGKDLGGMTLVPGVYSYAVAGAMAPNSVLTLDAGGDPNAQWVIQTGSTMIFNTGATVVFKDGVGNPENVIWQVGSASTISADVTVIGTIIAYSTITTLAGVKVYGRLYAYVAAVTIISTQVMPSTQ